MFGSISDPEIRAVKSLCGHPELDTAEKIADGPYARTGLTPDDFSIALLGLRDKLIAYEEEGHWRLTSEARKDLCTSEEPERPREDETREVPVPRLPDPLGKEDSLRRSRVPVRV